jgi:hypothetical protein
MFEEIDRVPMPSAQLMNLLGLDKKQYADFISPCKLDFSFA